MLVYMHTLISRPTRTPAKVLVAMLDVEEDFVSNSWAFCCLHRLGAEERRDGRDEEKERKTAEHDGGCGKKVFWWAGDVAGREGSICDRGKTVLLDRSDSSCSITKIKSYRSVLHFL